MWVADGWRDYEVLDTSGGEKLERWGKYILVRPDPQVIWNTPHDAPEWKKKNAHYHRSSKGGGQWEFFDLPEQWEIGYDLNKELPLKFHLKPFQFKHTGLFPEQAVNWEWMAGRIRESGKVVPPAGHTDGVATTADRQDGAGRTAGKKDGDGDPFKDPGRFRVLNLFAYTGGATVACAAAGAVVTHVDAAKGMVAWAKENAAASGLGEAPIRYLVDDCVKFVEREIRRGNRYDGIVMDPPSYGRGPKGEIWKIEEKVYDLIRLCTQILAEDASFFLINSYTTGLQPAVLTYMLDTMITPNFGGHVEASEIGLPVRNASIPPFEGAQPGKKAGDGQANAGKQPKMVLPCGASGRWSGR